MNNYFINQMKRAGFSWPERVLYRIKAFFCPGYYREVWRKHAIETQNLLNQNNWDKHGFYVSSDGKLCLDRCIFTNFGYFDHE